MPGEGYEGIALAYALFKQQVGIAPVPIHHIDVVVEFLSEFQASLMVEFYKFNIYAKSVQVGCQKSCDFVSSGNHHLLHVGGALAEVLGEQAHTLLTGKDVEHVVVLEYGVWPGDEGIVTSGDGYDAELFQFVPAKLLNELGEPQVQHGRVLVQPECGDLKLSVCEIYGLGKIIPLELGHYFVGSDFFGIEQEFYTQFVEHAAILFGKIFLVIDPGYRLLGPYMLCEEGTHDVGLLKGRRIDCDVEIALVDSGLLKYLSGRRIALDYAHIDRSPELGQAGFVVVDYGDVVSFVSQHLCQMRAHLACSLNNYSHGRVKL